MRRRTFLAGLAGLVGLAAPGMAAARTGERHRHAQGGEVLGQGAFRYRVDQSWGVLDPQRYPVEDCQAVVEDRQGRILVLTNDTRNNLLAYSKSGAVLSAWEHRFPAAHGLEISLVGGEERLWIVDHDLQVVSLCTLDGREVRRLEAALVAKPYAHLTDYHPTNVAVMPAGDFYVTDGYGAHFIHHLDPDWKYISSFGGSGKNPEQFDCPHAIWHDTRAGKPPLLVCDRGHAALKWFSLEGRLEKVVQLPGTQPSNVSLLGDHLVVASLNAMLLVLDKDDRLVSAIGGLPPVYNDGALQPVRVYNHSLYHPHDIHVDSRGDLYVPQWDSNHTYPVKLSRVK